MEEAFWRTIVEDYDGSCHPSEVDYLRGICLLETIWSLYDQNNEMSETFSNTVWADVVAEQKRLLHSDISRHTPGIDQDDWAQIGRITGVLRYRTFAITEKGYMAMVPPQTKPGDVVAIFLGCQVPQVLRQTGDSDRRYFHWGEAYVHGTMHGEGLGRSPEWLVLR
jgi:hypothetical protein